MEPQFQKLTLVLLFTILFASVNANTLVNFKYSDLNQVKNQGKKILVSFTAEWCTPCKIMDESIFNDHEIASIINDNFIAIKADVDSKEGNDWNELYNANYLPTTIFSLESGSEIERLNGTPSRDDFLNLLKKILAKDSSPPKATFAKSIESTEVSKPVPARILVKEPVSTTVVTTETNYSIQFGAFHSIDGALKRIDQLNQKGIFDASIFEETTNGIQYQKVILTGFANRSEAHVELEKLKQKGIDGFLKKM